ncbi:MAG: hypothetical protein EHM28_03965 [Spirochaetaceae bacterium]|nr:MAG: hypothetical protein EHM28_03965 [Spirochaetaceae bacterium]
MKKFIIVTLVAASILFVGCASEPKAKDPNVGPAQGQPATSEIIDHQFRGLSNVPNWVIMDQGEIEKLSDFKDYFVFKESLQGADLNATKVWASNFIVDSEIARLVSNRIQSKFAGAMVGSVNGADTYFEKIVKSLADAKVAGTRRHAEYWILRRYTDANKKTNDVYEYYILVKIPQQEVRNAVARAFDANPAKTETEVRARDVVRRTMDADKDW